MADTAPTVPSAPASAETPPPDGAARVERWRRMLLDFSLRNTLLNARNHRRCINLAVPSIDVLEDLIAAGKSFSIVSGDALLSSTPKDAAAAPGSGAALPADLQTALEADLNRRHRLWARLPEKDLAARLLRLYRQARHDLEEGGIQTLYLAVGFIDWIPKSHPAQTCAAPLILIPVELRRRTIGEGILLQRVEEDALLNTTFLEFLRAEFHISVAGLDPLPQDESGVNVREILARFREAVAGRPGWSVREEAALGHFIFSKFVMWNDLTARADALRAHPLVSHLISGGGQYDDGIRVFPPADLWRHLNLSQTYCPLAADTSQLTAVLYSALGKSFVLHGPPGTGKSQTIANLIAHNLALGRRVLFVSEKKAALDVVHRRLSRIGLKPFCLELHSNKAGKGDVIAQIREAIDCPKTETPPAWYTVPQETDALRIELDTALARLHTPGADGVSAYDCLSCLADPPPGLPSGLARTQPPWRIQSAAFEGGPDRIAAAHAALHGLADAWQSTTPEHAHAVVALRPLEWTPLAERELLAHAGRLAACAAALLSALAEARRLFPELPADAPRATLQALPVLFRTLSETGSCTPELFPDAWADACTALETDLTDGATRAALLAAPPLAGAALDVLRTLNPADIRTRLEEAADAFGPVRFFRRRAILRSLRPLFPAAPKTLTLDTLEALLPVAERFLALDRRLRDAEPRLRALLGARWQGLDGSDFDALQTFAARVRTLAQTAAAAALLPLLRRIAPEADTLLAAGTPARSAVDRLFEAHAALETELTGSGTLTEEAAAFAALEPFRDTMQQLNTMGGRLRDALRYGDARRQVAALGLASLADAFEAGEIPATALDGVFTLEYHAMRLEAILAAAPELVRFSGAGQAARIEAFRAHETRCAELSQQAAVAAISGAVAKAREEAPAKELGLLRRECEKKMRHKPVRTLLTQCPNLLPRLKPCFLMSPLSVAQYLPADMEPFDLLVFDEASQIPTWDAVGVISRARQTIVVGDPRQMPPTSFFTRTILEDDVDEEEDGAAAEATEADLESILDECLAAGLPSASLNWHYRSRHESLIAFSNEKYYGGRLHTFPAARGDETLGVHFRFVPDGVYGIGAARANRAEAEAIVAYLFEELRRTGRDHTFGIVTFSIAQQRVIEDILEKKRAENPDLEPFFDDQAEEPVFVKNLENVQGDERDILLFSICYAPDAKGRFLMNFGPLNLLGGERRLNVAVTRARRRVVVFSSIHANQIDLARTQAVGAAHLRDFLAYAESGGAFPARAGQTAASTDGIANAIERFLQERGWKTRRNIGLSDCKIDVAVLDPAHPDRAILGIECDGPFYAAQPMARDRETVRPGVLRSLGWRIFRVAAIDWLYDSLRTCNDLLTALQEAAADAQKQPSA